MRELWNPGAGELSLCVNAVAELYRGDNHHRSIIDAYRQVTFGIRNGRSERQQHFLINGKPSVASWRDSQEEGQFIIAVGTDDVLQRQGCIPDSLAARELLFRGTSHRHPARGKACTIQQREGT